MAVDMVQQAILSSIIRIIQPVRLSHQGWFLGCTKSSGALNLQQAGFLIKLKEQVSRNHTRWPSTVKIKKSGTKRSSERNYCWGIKYVQGT